MGLKIFCFCGFKKSSLLPVKKKMFTANNKGINILGVVFACLSGADMKGNTVQTVEMLYVSVSIDFTT